ncbi:hypothetical protein HGG74_15810 [Arthrobacter sp. E918]|uniref:Uncharacterized protein n=2 Tax=Arthrobacter mobilis TaxID=2724944 RepID=A0A7X6K5P0_9MICC|nr:hypothetical protein [Arthrobacter mobilis]
MIPREDLDMTAIMHKAADAVLTSIEGAGTLSSLNLAAREKLLSNMTPIVWNASRRSSPRSSRSA